SKCDWRAAFSRDDLIASHGANYAMPNLLDHLAAPSCTRLDSNWDRCGVHYVAPIETDTRGEECLRHAAVSRRATQLWRRSRRAGGGSSSIGLLSGANRKSIC